MEVNILGLFCDDVRRDEHGTFVLTGVYPGLMKIKDGRKSKLVSNYIQISGLDAQEHVITLKMILSTDAGEKIVARAVTEIEPFKEKGTLVLAPNDLTVPTEEDGTLRLIAQLDDQPEREIATVHIRINKNSEKKAKVRKKPKAPKSESE